MKSPKVTVVMPVYNREKYVAEAIESILHQTFTNFEFIIVDDGSTDSTYEILKSFKDERIKLLRKKTNNGNYSARNEGIKLAKGKYICVMDSDDISLPNRLRKQYDFMERNKHVGLCGSFVRIVDSDEIVTAPEDYEEIKVWSLSNIMFRHPTVFIRTEVIKRFKLRYNDKFRYAADYDFLVRATHLFPATNIQEVLLEYRRHPEQISTANNKGQAEVVRKVILSQLGYFNLKVSEEEKKLHLSLMNRLSITSESDFYKLKEWANFLLRKNNEIGTYHSIHLANFLKDLLKYLLKTYKISKKEMNSYKEAIQKINEILHPDFPLPFQKGWAILPDFTLELINLIKEGNSKSTIVECGSGLSTLILGYLAKNNNVGHIISLEHNQQFYETTKRDLQVHCLDKFVTLIYAPLKQIQIDIEQWLWYDVSRLNEYINQIDLLLIDGPPGMIQKHSRYPAFPILKGLFNKNTVILLDDSFRNDESEITERWLLENPEFSANRINTDKGLCILKQKA